MSQHPPFSIEPTLNKRRHRRQPARSNLRLCAFRNTMGLGPNIGISVHDLSETGCQLILNEELAIGKEFEIVFEGPAKTLKLHASVVRIRPTENGQFQVGVSFAKNVGVGELSHFVRA